MTATLNGQLCAEVRTTTPRYGYPVGWATLAVTDAPPVSGAPGALRLVAAGLEMVATAVYQGAPGGTRTVEIVGGYGGWRKPCAPKGFPADNLVALSDYAADLALAAGERVELAPGVDRKLGALAVRLGLSDAGALLSQACSLPVGAEVVPWWVDLDGTTRLGPRTGAAVTAQLMDSDPLGRVYSYAEEDARGLLPGCTIGEGTIEELRLSATGDSVREVVTLSMPGESPRTLPWALRRWLLWAIGPHVSARTLYRYSVREVDGAGRIRAVPVRSLLAPDLRGVRVWPGIAGGRCRPRVGSEVLVQFADGDPVADAACIVGFSPALVGSAGIPERAELDGDQVIFARGTHPTGRGGATFQLAGAAGAGTLVITDPDGVTHTWTLAATGLTITGGAGTILNRATIDAGRPEVLV